MRKEDVAQEGISTHLAELARPGGGAALSDFAAAVSHEIGNFLGGLTTCLQLLRGNPNLTEECAEILDMIQAGSERIGEFAADLSLLGRRKPLQLQGVDLNGLIEETLCLLQSETRLPSSIVIQREFDTSAQLVRADPDQLKHVFGKLFTSAVHAMEKRGELRVVTQAVGGHVKIQVQDSGPVIASEFLAKVFVPFSGARPGKTGLELAIAQYIVQEHAGRISVDNTYDKGARFVVTLPIWARKTRTQQASGHE